MKKMIKNEIIKSQSDYLNLIETFRQKMSNGNISMLELTSIIDEINIFWLKRKEVLSYELEFLTSKKQCFLLSGAIYLNISDQEHFFFKMLGDYHILSDPFLKMEFFFRNRKKIDEEATIEYFKRVFNDTYCLLKNYKNKFYILPIQVIIEKEVKEQQKLFDTFFRDFISSIFPPEIKDEEDFFVKYETYEEIEKDLDSVILENLIYLDGYDSKICLKERINRYCKNSSNTIKYTENMTEPQIFYILTKNYVSQVLDILFTCINTGLNPFIRFEATFCYMTLLMETFLDNKEIKEMLKKTIIFYILYVSINKNTFKNIDFDLYCSVVEETYLLQRILSKIRESNLDFFKDETNKIKKIVKSEFEEMKIKIKEKSN